MKRLITIATAAIASLTGIGGYLLVSATPASATEVICGPLTNPGTDVLDPEKCEPIIPG